MNVPVETVFTRLPLDQLHESPFNPRKIFAGLAELAADIKKQADKISALEKSKAEWLKPENRTFALGSMNYYVVNKDGAAAPSLAALQREAIKAHDEAIFLAKGKLEGLRYQMAKLGREGGAA